MMNYYKPCLCATSLSKVSSNSFVAVDMINGVKLVWKFSYNKELKDVKQGDSYWRINLIAVIRLTAERLKQ